MARLARAQEESFDAVIVGSGAAGGMAAYVLTQAGAKVLLLEAGRNYDPLSETPMFNTLGDAPLRGAPTPDKELGYYDATVNGGYTVPGEPYTQSHGTTFKWWRARMVGGRTNHWGRLAFRFGPFDFKGRSRDGLGVDWPISYDDIAPYYDRVERLIGVFGEAEGIENSPDSPLGVLMPAPVPRGYERWLQMVMGRRHGIAVVPAHAALLTKPLGDRAACFYASDCQRGCAIKATFQSSTVLLPPAVETRKLTVRTNAMAYEVITDVRGHAAGVRYVDALTGEHHEVRGRAVVLGASSCESARILLQSGRSGGQTDFANSSGQIGRNLMDTVAVKIRAFVPQLLGLPPFNDEGASVTHIYAPWWQTREQKAGKLDFPRGYHVEFAGGRRLPDVDLITEAAAMTDSIGQTFHRDMQHYYGASVLMTGRGEMLPNANSYCELDPEVKDRFGLPVLRFSFKWGEADIAQARHQRQTFTDIFADMGASMITDPDIPIEKAMTFGGEIKHEVGTVRMGSNPRDSVLDPMCESWTVPNLYVVDGGSFVSNPDKNPTLTIMALTWRAMDHLLAKRKGG